ncbi:MAG: M1 family metallopeptidase [Saprospiraceae bacterium]|nr:M1 family metallopeptidase [Saprospiraceae bacterium]
MNKYIAIIVAIVIMTSCSKTKDLTSHAEEQEMEYEFFDTLVVNSNDVIEPVDTTPYRASATKEFKLINTDLEVSFNWQNQMVIGKATLTLVPYFFEQDICVLDAENFEFKSVSGSDGRELKYEYDGNQIYIDLGKSYSRKDTLKVILDYVATPSVTGGSAAITSDKGLFFINPDGSDPDKPTQLWTQGETENNSKWVPTIDRPNQKTTQDIRITVDKKYQTLSNGLMVSSVDNGNGTRTDRWVQTKPHAPYLMMIAVGDFGRQSESWNNIKLDYYVDKNYEDYAKDIFNNTPEMLSFFSELLDYPYPWDKFSQIVVKDFVSGAMENTTAVVFGDFIQKDKYALADNNNDDIVAHEMFHHWFGDLVTCESWSNLTLNEGFANYSEYLWAEHKYGYEAAEDHRYSEFYGYLYSAQATGTHPLIDYHYSDREKMFDAHSYNKGGLILHMLRSLVGDDAFFAALHKYLVDNAYSDVEVAELRMAFEDVTGFDMSPFFDQWFLSEGHPVLEFSDSYNPDGKILNIQFSQTQDIEHNLAVYNLPLSVLLIYADGSKDYYDVDMMDREFNMDVKVKERPVAIIPDATADLLMYVNHVYSNEELLAIYKYGDAYIQRIQAFSKIESAYLSDGLLEQALKEPYYTFRREAIEQIPDDKLGKFNEQINSIIKNDPDSRVRAAAIDRIQPKPDAILEKTLAQYIGHDNSYLVKAAAILKLRQINLPLTIESVKGLHNVMDGKMLLTMADILSNDGSSDLSGFYLDNIKMIDNFKIPTYFKYMTAYLKNTNDNIAATMLTQLASRYFNVKNALVKLQYLNLFKAGLQKGGATADAVQQFEKLFNEKEDNSFLIDKWKG